MALACMVSACTSSSGDSSGSSSTLVEDATYGGNQAGLGDDTQVTMGQDGALMVGDPYAEQNESLNYQGPEALRENNTIYFNYDSETIQDQYVGVMQAHAQYLRDKYQDIPFIAIEPAYKMVYDYAYSEPTLVMATKGTIESEKFNLLYHTYDNHKTILLPCVGLADIIEEGNKDKIKAYLKEYLEPYRGKIKNVVLGCTHYPLIQEEMQEVLGQVTFFNGAPYLAKHLQEILEGKDLANNMEKKGIIQFIDSSNDEQKKKRFFEILEGKRF